MWTTFGLLVLAGGAAGGWWHWSAGITPLGRPAVIDSVRGEQNGYTAPPALQAPAPVVLLPPAEAPVAAAATTEHLPTQAASSPRVFVAAAADSGVAIQRQLRELRQRQFDDSVADEQRRTAEQQAVDSQRISDSLVTARAAEAKASEDQDALERQEAERRVSEEAAANVAAAARLRVVRLAAGNAALAGWLSGLVTEVNAGNLTGPVLLAGSAGFREFVSQHHPKLSEMTLAISPVNDVVQQATAEGVVRWRNNFGTTSSRRLKATALVMLDGDAWMLQSWRITEGGP
ncbi:MAG: hypothetical protein ABJC74_05760 [Gemmatimonadota bacterium]